ncbi:hypothetical protein [Clostridium perfringens]|uniref:hypothetical protein n=1 Tax=Clostridium perfringens TaxID=1502 RepID=UPI0011B200F8|nr:hypothetical protein [Clostridium perfringens]EGT5620275.1 hypothetical protein [Clostridium perfringens]
MKKLKNPRVEELELNSVESVLEDITNHMMIVDSLNVAGGKGYSDRKGNNGKLCTITVECQQICSWL